MGVLPVPQEDRQQGGCASSERVASADQRELVRPELGIAVVGELQQLLRLKLVVDVLGGLDHSLQNRGDNKQLFSISDKLRTFEKLKLPNLSESLEQFK